MATADEVVTILRANTSQHDAKIAASAAQFEKKMADMSAAATRAGNATSLIGVNPAFDKFAAGAGRGSVAANRLTKSVKGTSGQLQALPAQLNDIGVQLAGGQSPFLIAIQQGTQINQALGGQGLRGTISALGGAFAGLLNPVGLATIAIIGIGGVAIQYFSSLIEWGGKSEETLKKEAQLIQQIADKWGEALPALKAYAEEQSALAEQQKALSAVNLARENVAQPLIDDLNEVEVQITDVQQAFITLGNVGAADKIKGEFEELQQQVKDGRITQEDFNKSLGVMIDLAGQAGGPGQILIDLLESIRTTGGNAADEIARLNRESSSLTQFGPAIPGTRSLPGFNNASPVGLLPEKGPIPTSQHSIAFQDELYEIELASQRRAEAAARRSAAGSRRANKLDADDRIEQDIQAIEDRTAKLQLEQETMRSSYKEQQLRSTQFDLETKALKRLREEAEKKGETDLESIQLSADQVAAIESVSAAYAEQADQTRQSREEMQLQREILNGLFSDISSALEDGKVTAQEWGDIFLNVLDKIINKIEDDLVDALLGVGKTSSGIGGGIFGFLGSLFGGGQLGIASAGGIGLYHEGGVVGSPSSVRGGVNPAIFAGAQRYHEGGIAGLRPGEVPAILQRGELVIPKGQMRPSGGTSVVINAPINAPGADPAQLRRVEQSVKELGQSVPKMVDQRTHEFRTRKVRA